MILSGGIKEFIEWYPSQVTNRRAYLVRHYNMEIEELLDIDQVEYPEPGSTVGPNNVKLYSAASLSQKEKYRVDRDFPYGEGEEIITSSRSEGRVPLKMIISSEKIPGPFQSQSDSSLLVPQNSKTKLPKNLFVDEEIKFKIQDDRENLLKEARAVKPKPAVINTMIFESRNDAITAEELGLSFADVKIPDDIALTIQEGPLQAIKPYVDRSQKPKFELTEFMVSFTTKIFFACNVSHGV